MRPRLPLSPAAAAALYLLSALLLISTLGSFYSWLALGPSPRRPAVGCLPDGEGSWSVGFFSGTSPFSLRPVESARVWRNASRAWPVANPVVTCATASDSGFPSNFVADPFLLVKGNVFYLFFETKNSITLKGDIGVARSDDHGATWQHLGIALSEDWHLSYPYVFEYKDQIYMMPEGSRKGDLRLYRAVEFPLKWTFEKMLLDKPLIDSFIVERSGRFWLFGSDFSHFGAKKNGELEVWYSSSPFGPWKPHKKNPIHNTDKSFGARNAGRPFVYDGDLYRTGQDCGETYGQRIRVFKVEVLTVDQYKEIEVPLGLEESKKGRNAWNGARYHHLDAQKLPSGEWVAVVDGDRVPSGDSSRRLAKGYLSVVALALLVIITGVLLGLVNCSLLLSKFIPMSRKRHDVLHAPEYRLNSNSNLRWIIARVNRMVAFLQGKVKAKTCLNRFFLLLIFVACVALSCTGVHYLKGGNGAQEAYPINGHYSQFTLLTMTYDARIWNLKMFVKHYSRCSSVAEIVVVWNKGLRPNINDFDSAVNVRIRVEDRNSLNNRFREDEKIKTRGVLELDDDIMMTCDDLERGFKIWRENPDKIVGYYPRLVDGRPLEYRNERYARSKNGYNVILTGAAFIDKEFAFKIYWSEQARKGREMVDKLFNCEDVLLNFLYANASLSRRTVEYVRPAWAIDTSKFTGAAISKNTQEHYRVRSKCLNKFAEMYGTIGDRKWGFSSRKDGWDK